MLAVGGRTVAWSLETELGSGLGVACLLVGSVAEAEVLFRVRVRVRVSLLLHVKQHAVAGG